MVTKTLFAISLFFIIVSCTPQQYMYKEPLQEKGEVFIYLQPLPETAERLIFDIETISAVMEDGTEAPLSLSLHEIKGRELAGVQRLLGSAAAPEGEYRGISIKVGSASLKGREGPAALLVSGEPVTLQHVFRVKRRSASTLFLSLKPAEYVADGFAFRPLFNLTSGERELLSLTGYVSNTHSNTISVFNKKTMLNVGNISTGKAPRGIVLDQDRGRAYVALAEEDSIQIIDVVSGTVHDRMTLNSGDEPEYLERTPDGNVLVCVNHGSNTVSIIDAGSLFETGRVRVGEEPVSAVIDPLGLRAFVVNSMANTISVIDLSSKTLVTNIAVEGTPLRGEFNRKGDQLYIISRDIPDLTVVDPSGLSVSGKIFMGSGALSIKVDTRTGLIYAGNRTGGGISVLDPFSSMFIDTIRTGGTVAFMTIDDQENTLIAVNTDMKKLQKINITSKKIIAETDIGEGAYAVAVMGER